MKCALKSLLITFFIACLGCNNHKNSYAIRDFNKRLQPYLVQIVSKGIVGYDSAISFIEHHATDKELQQLSRSEHPVLRAVAFRKMLDRTTFDHFNLIMKSLNDTAAVVVDEGEFGIKFRMVLDDILQHAKWKDTSARNKTIEEIILNHNYLNAAYTKLRNIEPKEKYYNSIKEMIQRSRNYEENNAEIRFDEMEYALYGLAKFKRDEDIPLIKELLLTHCWRMTELSFDLMSKNPNETYMDIYDTFFKRSFYSKICQERNVDIAVSFINSVSTYKNERSAYILGSILNRKPFMKCSTDTAYIKEELVYAIWNNDCAAYSKLRKQVKSLVKQYERNNIYVEPIEPVDFPKDTSQEPVSWWQN